MASPHFVMVPLMGIKTFLCMLQNLFLISASEFLQRTGKGFICVTTIVSRFPSSAFVETQSLLQIVFDAPLQFLDILQNLLCKT